MVRVASSRGPLRRKKRMGANSTWRRCQRKLNMNVRPAKTVRCSHPRITDVQQWPPQAGRATSRGPTTWPETTPTITTWHGLRIVTSRDRFGKTRIATLSRASRKSRLRRSRQKRSITIARKDRRDVNRYGNTGNVHKQKAPTSSHQTRGSGSLRFCHTQKAPSSPSTLLEPMKFCGICYDVLSSTDHLA
jgi:hypothetical protein